MVGPNRLCSVHNSNLNVSDIIFAGLDTSSTTIDWLTGLLHNYPEVLKRAQKEIDDVVGSKRYPTSDDWKNLPYMNAVIKEVISAHTVALR